MWTYAVITISILYNVVSEYKYETKWFTVPLDHFGYQRNETFNIKYLVNYDNWDSEGGPIFIYTGNEAKVEVFAEHTGLMWEIASEFNAMVVFAEHRYYGQSMPFGNKSLDNEHIGYLTTAQALADFAELVNYLQGDSIHPKYPAIAFGGSYGGILAAYFRMKYPHIVAGAIAASAPVNMYPGMVPCDVHHKKVTSSFRLASETCVENIRNSWAVLRKFLSSQSSREWLQEQWKLCDAITTTSDVDTLMLFLQNMYEDLAMLNYPYASRFLRPLPARPVMAVCQHLSERLTEKELMEGIGRVLGVFANNSGELKCIEYKHGGGGSISLQAWEYQKCIELVMPRCSTGKEDMFEATSWNSTQYAEDCRKRYNVTRRDGITRVQYGGDRLQAASNIVFSNGLLDPWATGGILHNISNTVIAVLYDAAHHMDLMASKELDPPSVKMARNVHRQNIARWISEFRKRNKVKRRLLLCK